MRSIGAALKYSLRITAFAATGMFAFSTAGCALFGSKSPEQTMVSSKANTSGAGTVRAEIGPNGNTQLEVQVKHLSEPAKVAADASVYVVWIQPRNGQLQNVGAMRIDDELVASLETTTPHRAFTLIVTPEPSPRMAAPSHPAVFTAEVTSTN